MLALAADPARRLIYHSSHLYETILQRVLNAINVRAPVSLGPAYHADLCIQAGSSPGRNRYDIAVEVAVVPNWHDDLVGVESAVRSSLDDPSTPGHWCFVFDEADLLFEGLSGQPGIPVVRLLRMLRALAQETDRVASVFIGRDSTPFYQPEIQGAQNPMLGWVNDYWMDAVSHADAHELLTRLGKRVGLELDATHLSTAWQWSGGQVILLRQFGSAMLEVARNSGQVVPPEASDQAIVDAFVERQMVGTVMEETFRLLEIRYPDAYALLLDLLAGADAQSVLTDHGGWIAGPARSLRNFRLLSGTAAAPTIPRWVRWYGSQSVSAR